MSNNKLFLEEISNDVKDIKHTEFEYVSSSSVPNRGDGGLTFGRNQKKRGKILKTCVLYVDIRNSVALTEKHQHLTMAKIYTAFTKSVIKAAKKYNGHIRNIIGDRVMVVFEPANCFTNAVNCAITINHIANIVNVIFSHVDFKCGIGVDYGDMRVLKVGIQKNGNDSVEHRGLVWSGKAANLASRLTDVANKEIEDVFIELSINEPVITFVPSFKLLRYQLVTKRISLEEFNDKLEDNSESKLKLKGFSNIISYRKIKQSKKLAPILISDVVFNGYKKESPETNDIKNGWWKKIDYKVKNINYDVYGASLNWKLN